MNLFLLILAVFNLPSEAAELRTDRSSLTTPYYQETVAGRQANQERLRTLFSENHIGLEIILAEGSPKSPQSRFGHIFLRFIDEDGDPFDDAVVGFVGVQVSGRSIEIFDYIGLGQPILILPEAGNLGDMLVTYQAQDKRDMARFIIPAFPEQIEEIKQMVIAVTVAPDLLGNYNLTTNNCFSALKKIMTQAGMPFFPNLIVDHMFGLDEYFAVSLISPYPSIDAMTIQGTDGIFKYVFSATYQKWLTTDRSIEEAQTSTMSRLDLSHELQLMGTEEFWQEIEKLDDTSIGKLTHYWPIEWKEHRPRLVEIYHRRGLTHKTYRDFTVVKDFPPNLYRSCSLSDISCRDERRHTALAIWSLEHLSHRIAKMQGVYYSESRRTEQLANSIPKTMSLQQLTSRNAQDNIRFLE